MLILGPALMGLGALWAVVPDLPRFFGFYELYHRLARDPRTDIFFWHYTIDGIEGESPWFVALLVLMLAAILFAAWRELYLLEKS